MNIILSVAAAAMALAGGSLAGAAPPGAVTTVPVAARPPNSVSCIYEAITPEQRETAQVLMVASQARGTGEIDKATEEEITATIESAIDACIAHYPWAQGKTMNAVGFAFIGLSREVMADAMVRQNLAPTDIETWFAANKAGFGLAEEPSAAQKAALAGHLAGIGWATTDPHVREGAEIYLAMLNAQEFLRRNFARGVFYR